MSDSKNLLKSIPFRSKEVSWLSFNARVLQEATDPSVPLLERLKFLGIYSSNLDEFFRVRVATLKRLAGLGKYYKKLNIPNPSATLKEVSEILSGETEVFNDAYTCCMADLREEGVRLINQKEVPEELAPWLADYFRNEVRPHLMPIMIKASLPMVGLRDQPMYLAVEMSKTGKKRKTYALLDIPTRALGRFVVLPEHSGETLVMYLDDIIRFGIPDLFSSLPYDHFDSFAIKFTRDAEYEIDDDITESFFEKVSEGLRSREEGNPVRLNYDATIPPEFLEFLLNKLHIRGTDTLYPGARYHNRRDLMGFPKVGSPELRAPAMRSARHPELEGPGEASMFSRIRKRDHLLHFPYQSFNVFLDLLREASIDPRVRTIQITQYRLAKRSCVAKALINAVRSGKQVVVMVEPTARFDEEANIAWADTYQQAGVHVILGVPGLKVHTKLCLITRSEGKKTRCYTAIGTGNFNEDTADLYTDLMLLTANKQIGKDATRIFRYFTTSYRTPKLERLVCAPFHLRKRVCAMIEREIDHTKAGRPSGISIKINNFSDPEVTDLLYKASKAGVPIRLIVRSMFSLVTEDPEFSESIQAIGIVDSLLEHSRILRFENGGEPEYFLSSADFLPRNFDSRVETLCPIDDPRLRKDLDTYLDLHWRDSQKARLLDGRLANLLYEPPSDKGVGRSQAAIAKYLGVESSS